ncbi:MAG TPA: tetratricopeptide repeat protein [Roseiflexaceae bacterium]|nr:tetratricopeptide repeat protein [Roseiflexaceae bacterium]
MDGLITRAGIREDQGDTASALADYAAALGLAPDNALALNNRAYLCARHGRFEQALADLHAALAVAPRYLTALCSLAETLIAMGEHEQGLDWLERAITLYPGVRDLARSSPDYDAVRGLPRFEDLRVPHPARRAARLAAMPSVDLETVRLAAVDARWRLRAEQPAADDTPYTLVWEAADTDTTITYREAPGEGPLARTFAVEGEDVEGVVVALHTALDLYTDGELRRLLGSSEF